LARSFTVIGDANLAVLKAVNDEDWPVIGPFYKSCMDSDTMYVAKFDNLPFLFGTEN
jgi:hypothetical protein